MNERNCMFLVSTFLCEYFVILISHLVSSVIIIILSFLKYPKVLIFVKYIQDIISIEIKSLKNETGTLDGVVLGFTRIP